MTLVFSLLARMPLAFMQALGGFLGWLVWCASPAYRRQFRHQVALSGVDPARARKAIAAAGRMGAELPWAWSRPADQALSDRVSWDG